MGCMPTGGLLYMRGQLICFYFGSDTETESDTEI